MRRLLHRIAHALGWFSGRVETWTADGAVMVGLRCSVCGEVCGIERIPESVFDRPARSPVPGTDDA